MKERMGFVLILIVLGAGWGITQPFSKIAVSGGYRHFGLIFWQMAITSVILGAILAVRLFHDLSGGCGLAAIASAGGIGSALLVSRSGA